VRGMVLFSHGSESNRKSPRNTAVAAYLNLNGIGTLLFDLLNVEEVGIPSKYFEIDLMTDRLVRATAWLSKRDDMAGIPMGFFGSGTGSASAMCAAVKIPAIAAVVTRSGRSEFAVDKFIKIKCPVLFIVGELDKEALVTNHTLMLLMKGLTRLETVDGATRLFPEKGKMAKVAKLALGWFRKYLVQGSA
jgi:putative phosphoribosyl transferase